MTETFLSLSPQDGLGPSDHYEPVETSAAPSLPAPPLFTLGHLPDTLRPDFQAASPMPNVGLYRLHDVRVTFDGILSRAGQLFDAPDLNHPRAHIALALAYHVPGWRDLPVRRIGGEAVLLYGPGYDVYGHWLIDFLPRLWLLRRCGFDTGRLRYLVPVPLPPFALRLLETFGIGKERLIGFDQKHETLQCEWLIAPSLLRRSNRISPLLQPAATYLITHALSAQPARIAIPDQPKIYVARRRQDDPRFLLCRAEIESVAREAGYAIIFAERMSVAQQMRIFQNATHIAGEYGSDLHNAIFAPPGTKLCVLRGTSHHPGFAQSGIAEACGHDIAYVFGATPEHADRYCFTLSPSDVAAALRRLESEAPTPENRAVFPPSFPPGETVFFSEHRSRAGKTGLNGLIPRT